MREEFKALISGWTLTSMRYELTDLLDQISKWTRTHEPLKRDEIATIELIVQTENNRSVMEGDSDYILLDILDKARKVK